jgi:hypothetical protein
MCHVEIYAMMSFRSALFVLASALGSMQRYDMSRSPRLLGPSALRCLPKISIHTFKSNSEAELTLNCDLRLFWTDTALLIDKSAPHGTVNGVIVDDHLAYVQGARIGPRSIKTFHCGPKYVKI